MPMVSAFFALFTRLPCLGGVQNLPKFIDTGESLLPLNSTLFDNSYKPVGDAFTAPVYTKNVCFQKTSSCRLRRQKVSRFQ
jgi:hypothetical protein